MKPARDQAHDQAQQEEGIIPPVAYLVFVEFPFGESDQKVPKLASSIRSRALKIIARLGIRIHQSVFIVPRDNYEKLSRYWERMKVAFKNVEAMLVQSGIKAQLNPRMWAIPLDSENLRAFRDILRFKIMEACRRHQKNFRKAIEMMKDPSKRKSAIVKVCLVLEWLRDNRVIASKLGLDVAGVLLALEGQYIAEYARAKGAEVPIELEDIVQQAKAMMRQEQISKVISSLDEEQEEEGS